MPDPSFSPDWQGYQNATTSPQTLSLPAGSPGDSLACFVISPETTLVTVTGFTLQATINNGGYTTRGFTRLRDGTESGVTVISSGPAKTAASVGNFPGSFIDAVTLNLLGGPDPTTYIETVDEQPLAMCLFTTGANTGQITDPGSSGFSVKVDTNAAGIAYTAKDQAQSYGLQSGAPVSVLAGFIRLLFGNEVATSRFWSVGWQ